MDKKVVFLDVDGTMVNEKGEIPESAQYAVRTAQANGHRMVVCSGRSRFQIYDALLELGFPGSSAEPEPLWRTREKSFIMHILMRNTEKAVLII